VCGAGGHSALHGPGERRAASGARRRRSPASPGGGGAGQGARCPVAHLPLWGRSSRCGRRLLGPDRPAAPGRHCLALLPPGSDAVRRLPVRGAWPSTRTSQARISNDNPLEEGLGPAEADCGFREPLAPRLARPGPPRVALVFEARGRVAQRESARLTRGRSLVRSQPRPLNLALREPSSDHLPRLRATAETRRSVSAAQSRRGRAAPS
jgi:hypothetical protein